MFEFLPTKIELNISFIPVFFAFITAGIITYFYYRRTTPPVSFAWQIYLAISRGITLALIIIVFFAPEIKIQWDQPVKRKLVFAIDCSASMNITEKKVSRIERAGRIAGEIKDKIENHLQIKLYGFDSDTVMITLPEIKIRGMGTDIENALKKIIERQNDAAAIILISDGIFTLGDNPVYSNSILKRKIFTIGIGDTMEIPDISVKDVRVNKIVYRNQNVPVHVEISSQGIETSSYVWLKQDEKILASRRIDLKGDGTVTPLTFTLKPKKLGLIDYKIEIEKFQGEEFIENNQFVTSVEVLKDKINVGILASKPNYDVKFLDQIYNSISDINVISSITGKGRQTFLTGFDEVVDSSDVLILHNYPDLNTSQQYIDKLLKMVTQNNLPVILFLSNPLFRNQIKFIGKIFPIISIQNTRDALLVQVRMTQENEFSSILKVYDRDDDNMKFWSKCPPIEYIYYDMKLGDQCKILLETSSLPKNQPVLLAYQTKWKKRLLFLGSGFWRWKFRFIEDSQFKNGWQMILHNIIRWIARGGQNDNIIIRSQKKSYQMGETVNFTVEVYDGLYNPVSDASVRVKISAEEDNFEIDSENIGNGSYRCKFVPLKQGSYTILAEAWKNDIQLGDAVYTIMATPVNNEFLYTKQDYKLLQRLAVKTGGKYFPENQFEDIISNLDITPNMIQTTTKIELWSRVPILILIIIFLAFEWYVRKRKGLA